MKLVKDIQQNKENLSRISDQQAEEAIKTIIEWIGEEPNREGLKSTPKRVGLHFDPNETFPVFQAGDCEHYFGALSANFIQPIDTQLPNLHFCSFITVISIFFVADAIWHYFAYERLKNRHMHQPIVGTSLLFTSA